MRSFHRFNHHLQPEKEALMHRALLIPAMVTTVAAAGLGWLALNAASLALTSWTGVIGREVNRRACKREGREWYEPA